MRRLLDSTIFRSKPISLWAVLALISLTSVVSGQIPNDYAIGFPPQADFSGSDFESVQINNNNLHIEIPIWSTAGRGFPAGFKYGYDSKGWGFGEHCNRLSGTCTDWVTPNPRAHTAGICCSTNNLQWTVASLTGASATSAGNTATCDGTRQSGVYSFVLAVGDGTKHHFLPDPVGPPPTCTNYWTSVTTVYADDGSGWMMNVDPSGGTVSSIYRKDGSLGAYEDTNGNQVTGGTDTLGRAMSPT